AAAPADRLAALVRDLDSNSFQVREKAAQELKKYGLAAEQALLRAAKNNPSLETGRRIEKLLADIEASADWQRTLTALQLLEGMPAAPAREILQGLAKGDPDSRLTREAEAMLQRLLKRGDEPKR